MRSSRPASRPRKKRRKAGPASSNPRSGHVQISHTHATIHHEELFANWELVAMRLGEAGAESSFWGSSIKSFIRRMPAVRHPEKKTQQPATIAILRLLLGQGCPEHWRPHSFAPLVHQPAVVVPHGTGRPPVTNSLPSFARTIGGLLIARQ